MRRLLVEAANSAGRVDPASWKQWLQCCHRKHSDAAKVGAAEAGDDDGGLDVDGGVSGAFVGDGWRRGLSDQFREAGRR